MLFIGESPRWLCLKGRHEEAKKAFWRYHYDGSNEAWCETEFTIIQVNIEEERKAQGRLSWADLFKTPAAAHPAKPPTPRVDPNDIESMAQAEAARVAQILAQQAKAEALQDTQGPNFQIGERKPSNASCLS